MAPVFRGLNINAPTPNLNKRMARSYLAGVGTVSRVLYFVSIEKRTYFGINVLNFSILSDLAHANF